MPALSTTDIPPGKEHKRPARTILFAFLCTFLASRIMVLLIMLRRVPDFYLHLGGNHIHHLNYGIFLLSAVGAWSLLGSPAGRQRTMACALYGIGLALTFDEFGMWVHLGGSYWQRASWDAMAVLSAALALLAYAPAITRFRPRHWLCTLALVTGMALFGWLLVRSLSHAETIAEPRLMRIEQGSPK